ncbi:MAG TPA: hydrogenase maturation protease [Polyangiaceae bacterium]
MTLRPGRQGFKPRRARLLVLGLGNMLLADDGVGVLAAQAFAARSRVGVLVAECGTATLSALPLLEWAERVIIVDALAAGGAPGTLYWGSIEVGNVRTPPSSIHDADLAATLTFLRREAMPTSIYLLGIEPLSLELGWGLTAPLRDALPRVLSELETHVTRLRHWND